MLDIKNVIFIQDEYTGDYIGVCPKCKKIFTFPLGLEHEYPYYPCKYCRQLIWAR